MKILGEKKKLISIIVAVVLVCVVGCLVLFGNLSSCSGGKTDLYILSSRPEDDAYYTWLKEKFESEYDCKIDLATVATDQYADPLKSQLRANAVDVFSAESTYLYDEGLYSKMLTLDDMSYNSKINEYAAKYSKLDGEWKICPLNIVTFVVFYNKSIFTKHNLQEPTTWTEFIDICDVLAGDSQVTSPILYCGLESWPINMVVSSIEYPVVRAEDPDYYYNVWVNGTQRFDEAGGLYEEYFDKARELFGYVQENSTGTSYGNKSRLFAKGTYGMTIDGSWAYKDISAAVDGDFEIGSFVLPASDKAENNTKAPGKMGGGWSINKDSPNLELAKKFVEFQMREDVYQRYLDDVQMDSTVVGMQSKVEALKEIYRYDTILNFENYKIMGFNYQMQNSYGADIIKNTVKTSTLLEAIQIDNDTSKAIWSQTKNVNSWKNLMHPEKN